MESIVHDEIVRHLDNLFRDSQHGFWHGRSYTSNLLEILDIVSEQVNQKDNVDVIFLDFAKAVQPARVMGSHELDTSHW